MRAPRAAAGAGHGKHTAAHPGRCLIGARLARGGTAASSARRRRRVPTRATAGTVTRQALRVLIHTLAQNDLLDEYHLLVYPVVLGGGKQVFAEGPRVNLRLIESRPLPSGVVLTHYSVERPA